jgi:endonuclease YncB( thermonuclease family)
MKRFYLACTALLLLTSPCAADPEIGRASVIDGDTLEIRGTRIRLHGVDAPESGQSCLSRNGKNYRCGQHAALALSDKIGTSNVSCEQKDIDRYKRIVAVCTVRGEDINAWLVQQGYALAYRQYGTDYISEEEKARAAKRGLWAGSFTSPWDWRRGKRDSDPPITLPTSVDMEGRADEGSDCRIKGNINQKGQRIYHIPSSRDYERTKLDEAAGERWFCSESEAISAGWRAPGR